MKAKRYNSPAILFLDKEGPLVTWDDYERLKTYALAALQRTLLIDGIYLTSQISGETHHHDIMTAIAEIADLLGSAGENNGR